MNDVTVVCVKVGAKYGPEYVNRLAAMVERNTTLEHRFVCLTDNPEGVEPDCQAIGVNWPGWWAKVGIFKRPMALGSRRLLYLDLDTIIAGNIDCLLDYRGDFAILRDFYRPHGYQSAMMLMGPHFGRHLYDNFKPEHMEAFRGRGDQGYIESQVTGADLIQDMWPGRAVSYKVHCLDGPPKGAAVINLHGRPKPHELPQDNWARRIWEGRC